MTDTRPIAVVGATGQQGGAVLDALRRRGAPVRALVRDAGRADDLRERGAELAVADLDDGASLRRAFDGVAAVFAMTTMTGDDGVAGEVAHGRAIADAARDARVPHLLYSSVGGAERDTGIPHFDSKWRVEQYLHEVGVPTVVLRPTFFMENFATQFTPSIEDGEVVLRAPLAPGRPLQMIAVRDIGRAAATGLLDPAAVVGGAVEIAGDECTGEAVAAAFGAAAGLRGRFEAMEIDELGVPDAEAMFRWFVDPPAYEADVAATRALVGGDPLDIAAFAAAHAPTAG